MAFRPWLQVIQDTFCQSKNKKKKERFLLRLPDYENEESKILTTPNLL